MKQKSRAPLLLLLLAPTLACCAAWAMQTGVKLTMDGSVLSTDVQIVNGRAYVPLSDMAKSLGRNAVRSGNAYRLTQGGDAGQIHGVTGKIDTNISSGTWILKVLSVQQVTGYSPLYGVEKDPLIPKEADEILVLIKCRLKNGTNAIQEVDFDQNSAGNTALTDDQEHAYVPLAYDSRNSSYTSDKILPGSAHDFTVIFSVPKSINIKDLIYTVATGGMDKPTDFRVSLKP